MNEAQTQALTPDQIKTNRTRAVFVLLAAYLILAFLWRVLIPAHEYDSMAGVLLTVALDLIALVVMILLKRRIDHSTRAAQPKWQIGNVLFIIALIAGFGLFGIRFLSGAHGWWTGHLIYTLR